MQNAYGNDSESLSCSGRDNSLQEDADFGIVAIQLNDLFPLCNDYQVNNSSIEPTSSLVCTKPKITIEKKNHKSIHNTIIIKIP